MKHRDNSALRRLSDDQYNRHPVVKADLTVRDAVEKANCLAHTGAPYPEVRDALLVALALVEVATPHGRAPE
jgi:hypothetical protein